MGDYRNNCVGVCQADGTRAADFRYVSWEIREGGPFRGLPCLFDEDETAETLVIFLEDAASSLKLELYYVVFADRDVIARSARITNGGKEAVRLEKMMSACLANCRTAPGKRFPFPRAARHGAKAGAFR